MTKFTATLTNGQEITVRVNRHDWDAYSWQAGLDAVRNSRSYRRAAKAEDVRINGFYGDGGELVTQF